MRASAEGELIRVCGGDIHDGWGGSESMKTIAEVSAKSVGRVGVKTREDKAIFSRDRTEGSCRAKCQQGHRIMEVEEDWTS